MLCDIVYLYIGCEYGDKFARCSYTGRLECLINSDDCCSTCAYYSKNTSGNA